MSVILKDFVSFFIPYLAVSWKKFPRRYTFWWPSRRMWDFSMVCPPVAWQIQYHETKTRKCSTCFLWWNSEWTNSQRAFTCRSSHTDVWSGAHVWMCGFTLWPAGCFLLKHAGQAEFYRSSLMSEMEGVKFLAKDGVVMMSLTMIAKETFCR